VFALPVFETGKDAIHDLVIGTSTTSRNDSSHVFVNSLSANTPVSSLPIHSLSILDLSHLSFTEAVLPCDSQLKKQAGRFYMTGFLKTRKNSLTVIRGPYSFMGGNFLNA